MRPDSPDRPGPGPSSSPDAPLAVPVAAPASEDDLRASVDRLRSLFENAPVGIFHSVPEGRFRAVNPALVEMLGYSSPEELIREATDMGSQIYADPEVRPRVMAALAADEGWVHYDEVRWRRKDGRLITVDMTGRRVLGPAGEVAYLEGFIVDVTQRKQAEEELRLSNARYDELARQVPVGIHTVRLFPDGTARVEYCSDRLCQLLGVDRRDVLRDVGTVYGALHPDDRASLIEANRRAAESLRPFRWEGRCRVGGDLRWIRIESEATPLPGGDSLWSGVVIDVTDRRRADEEVQRLNSELEERVLARTRELTEANRELEAYSYSVAHELRAPLRAIDGFTARIVAASDRPVDDEERRHHAQVRWNAQRMGRLIDDLLTFSQVGRVCLSLVPVDMTRAAKTAFDRVVTDPVSKAQTTLSLGDLPEAHGDAALLSRVWENLLSNAVKFSAGRQEPGVRVEGEVEGSETVYRVRDNGVGFDMRYVDKLFGVFHRLHGTHEFEGTGVGLALVRRIVLRHGGRVWAEGEPDRGATFAFSLPAKGGKVGT